MYLIFIMLGYLLVGFFEAKQMIKDKELRKLKYYLSLMILSFGLSIIVIYSNESTNIAQFIEKIIKPAIK